ncbi:exodeoxyribonuclease VII large subunit [Helicobacter mesocricetorum]|uniref:exodeoxyribonuclease VII large subunit n=1 Tax=Helicobacter mesocricetorum TaxID=87012 RepID=UPI000CF0D310|nr:exodeoxyribonuclease VII large subunit [Helicobacter mesocricetorum]
MQVLSVSALNLQIKSLLEATFLQVSVCGEVSNCTYHSSGHLYFTLKDKDSNLKCVMFRGNVSKLKFKITEGSSVILFGAISLYTPRGEYQLNCISATPSGIGELTLAYQQLKEEYEKKGYFKKQQLIPKFPKKVALLTSKSGAVLHDMLRVAQKRWELTEFFLLDTLVQGEGAKEEIARNLKYADSLGVDCVVLARGGGSLEDLWAFNEPLVVEAIFNMKTPVISAIGHEPDVVLSDFVADLRAPTPSAAMELLLPDKNECLMGLDFLQRNLEERIKHTLESKLRTLNTLIMLLEKNPFFHKIENLYHQFHYLSLSLQQKLESKLKKYEYALKPLEMNLMQKLEETFYKNQNHLESLRLSLESKNPKNYQRKGYVFAHIHQKPIQNLLDLKFHSNITLEDSRARVLAQVLEIHSLEDKNS